MGSRRWGISLHGSSVRGNWRGAPFLGSLKVIKRGLWGWTGAQLSVMVAYICHHNTEYGYNNTYIGTSNVILANHLLWLPNDGLCKLKHVGAAFIVLIVVIV
jgi:hypothetical protein